MNRQDVLRIMKKIGAANIEDGPHNIMVSCLLARWRKGHKSGTDSRPSMGISVNEFGRSVVHCFGCEYGGSVEMLLTQLYMQTGNSALAQVIEEVNELEAVDLDDLVDTLPEYDDSTGYKEVVIEESEIAHMMGAVPRYILRRGIDLETCKTWGVGHDTREMRVVFPLRRVDGTLAGMVGRDVSGRSDSDVTHPKTKNYFRFDRGRYLYGEQLVRPNTVIVAVEGCTDCLMVWQTLRDRGALDQYSVVAFLGAMSTRHQHDKLARLGNEVVSFLDNDAAGEEGRDRLAKALQDRVLFRSVWYPQPEGLRWEEHEDQTKMDPAVLVSKGVDIVKLIDDAPLYRVSKGDRHD